jgi:hypothetical protein
MLHSVWIDSPQKKDQHTSVFSVGLVQLLQPYRVPVILYDKLPTFYS